LQQVPRRVPSSPLPHPSRQQPAATRKHFSGQCIVCAPRRHQQPRHHRCAGGRVSARRGRHPDTASTHSIRCPPRERHSLLAALGATGFINNSAFKSWRSPLRRHLAITLLHQNLMMLLCMQPWRPAAMPNVWITTVYISVRDDHPLIPNHLACRDDTDNFGAVI